MAHPMRRCRTMPTEQILPYRMRVSHRLSLTPAFFLLTLAAACSIESTSPAGPSTLKDKLKSIKFTRLVHIPAPSPSLSPPAVVAPTPLPPSPGSGSSTQQHVDTSVPPSKSPVEPARPAADASPSEPKEPPQTAPAPSALVDEVSAVKPEECVGVSCDISTLTPAICDAESDIKVFGKLADGRTFATCKNGEGSLVDLRNKSEIDGICDAENLASEAPEMHATCNRQLQLHILEACSAQRELRCNSDTYLAAAAHRELSALVEAKPALASKLTPARHMLVRSMGTFRPEELHDQDPCTPRDQLSAAELVNASQELDVDTIYEALLQSVTARFDCEGRMPVAFRKALERTARTLIESPRDSTTSGSTGALKPLVVSLDGFDYCEEAQHAATREDAQALLDRGCAPHCGEVAGNIRGFPDWEQSRSPWKDTSGGFHCTPIVLDLDGDGRVTQTGGYVAFDINADGALDRHHWLDPGDGWLVRDVNGDGLINDGSELFGSATVLPNGETARDGFEALPSFDRNQDGQLDADEAELAGIQLWRDDGDARSEAGELRSFRQLGIAALSLVPDRSARVDNAGNALSLVAPYTLLSGGHGRAIDVVFRTTLGTP